LRYVRQDERNVLRWRGAGWKCIRAACVWIGQTVDRASVHVHDGSKWLVSGLCIRGNGIGSVVIDAISATHRGRAVTEHVPGETYPRTEVCPPPVEHTWWNPGVTGIENPGWRVRIARGLCAWMIGCHLSQCIRIGEERIPA